MLTSGQKELEKLGIYCLYSLSLNECELEDIEELQALPMLLKRLDSHKSRTR